MAMFLKIMNKRMVLLNPKFANTESQTLSPSRGEGLDIKEVREEEGEKTQREEEAGVD